ncbi:hypothetical protein DFH07DRAFT_241848 [Mycena maculata]|uniref:Uncharacterized protein n=1 Tax=Mycena maculata TaxID=230809 RepID=A0AAD7JT44_9AGAR|nr:hypothetical protein DFH07DRAFT_241848 [Mycena maculata]
MFGRVFALVSLALFVGANAQSLCTSGTCYNSPANATDLGCEFWDGGVNAWATCGFEGAVTCTTCFACSVGGCYASPDQATSAGCAAWAGGVDAWTTCGFEGAVTCTTCL